MKDYPLQHSVLENSMDFIVHGVTKNLCFMLYMYVYTHTHTSCNVIYMYICNICMHICVYVCIYVMYMYVI